MIAAGLLLLLLGALVAAFTVCHPCSTRERAQEIRRKTVR